MKHLARQIAIAVAMGVAYGCTTSAAQFELKSPQLVENVGDSYQAVYERVYRMARKCYVTSGMTMSMDVEAQLFSDLGYGELLFTFINMGMKTPTLRVRVDKADAAARVSITSDFYAENVQTERRQKLLGWARGKAEC